VRHLLTLIDRFIVEIAGWGCESAHWAIADALVRLTQSFEDVDDPLFIAWPEPCLPHLMLEGTNEEAGLNVRDPFYLDFIARIVDLNECECQSPGELRR
jgi:hypothetical protein